MLRAQSYDQLNYRVINLQVCNYHTVPYAVQAPVSFQSLCKVITANDRVNNNLLQVVDKIYFQVI